MITAWYYNNKVNKMSCWCGRSDGHKNTAAHQVTCGECLCTSHSVTKLFKVPLHEIFALHDVVLGRKVLHAVFSLQLRESEEVKRLAGCELAFGAV